MLKFLANGVNGNKVLNFPTKVEEITPEYLLNVTKDVEVADNYVLVALCYREKISTILMTARQNKKDVTSAVIPLFIKSGRLSTNGANEESFISKIKTGDKIIAASSQLALGHHVVCPMNTLNINNLIYYTEKDGFAYQRAVNIQDYIHFLEFKIIPANDVIAFRPKVDSNFDNPFKIEDASEDVTGGELN